MVTAGAIAGEALVAIGLHLDLFAHYPNCPSQRPSRRQSDL